WRPDFPSAWSGWSPWVASFALFCLWLILGIRFIDGFYEDVILNEFGARFHEGIHRSQPLLFYIPHLLQNFASWSLLNIGLLASAIIFAAIFTGTYAAMRVIGGYRYDRDALVKFGREVRRIATAEHLRYEILPGRDESLLLYLQRPRFYTRIETIAASPGLDALVVPIDDEPWRSGKFPYRVTVEKKSEHPSSYGFLTLPRR